MKLSCNFGPWITTRRIFAYTVVARARCNGFVLSARFRSCASRILTAPIILIFKLYALAHLDSWESQFVPTHCMTLQHTATHCNTLLQRYRGLRALTHPNSWESWFVRCVLQCISVCCSVLHHSPKHNASRFVLGPSDFLQMLLYCWNTFLFGSQHTATCCNTHCNALQHTETQCSKRLPKRPHGVQYTAAQCSTVQHTVSREQELFVFSLGILESIRKRIWVSSVLVILRKKNKHYTHCNTPKHTATDPTRLLQKILGGHTPKHTATHCNRSYSSSCVGETRMKRAATHYNALQRTATHCNRAYLSSSTGETRRKHTATHCSTLQHTTTCCNRAYRSSSTGEPRMKNTATHCNALQTTATHCNTMQQNLLVFFYRRNEDETHCKTLQQTATDCNRLQHTEIQCNGTYSSASTGETMMKHACCQPQSKRRSHVLCTWMGHVTHMTWLIHICDMNHSHSYSVWQDLFKYVSFICANWFIYMCGMSQSHVRFDSSTRVTCLIHILDMTYSYVWHDSSMCDQSHPYNICIYVYVYIYTHTNI